MPGGDDNSPSRLISSTRAPSRFIPDLVQGGLTASQATSSQLNALSRYGAHIGLAFQIVDDILDIVGAEKEIGKNIGSDVDKSKATYPALYGLEESKRKAQESVEEGIDCLTPFGESAEPLRDIARFFVQRTF